MEHLISYYETQREQLPIPLKFPIQDEKSSTGSEIDDSGNIT